MQNVYITRNGKQIQLTVNEIMAAWVAWDDGNKKTTVGLTKKKLNRHY